MDLQEVKDQRNQCLFDHGIQTRIAAKISLWYAYISKHTLLTKSMPSFFCHMPFIQ